MANDTAKTSTINIVPVQGIFEPLPPYPCVTLIGPAGEPFYAPTNPNMDGVHITNSTIDSSVIGGTTPAAATFTNIATTTGTISSVPSGPTSIVNQSYVDAVAQGLAFKQPANYSTTGNITLSGLATQANGDWPSSLTAGMRILVKDQTAPAENGIYVASATGWTRSSDANTWDELTSAYLFVTSGTILAGSAWVNTDQPGGTLGVTAVSFVQFSGNAVYTAGTGLTLSGYQFSITNTGVTANSYGGASKTLSATVNAQGQLTALSEQSIAIANTQVSGLGTMSTQNANNVAITGGAIDGTTIGGSTAAAVTGTTVTANTQFSGPGTGLTGTASSLSIGGNAATATLATTATNLAGGSAGAIPYQTASGTTTMLTAGSNGQYLVMTAGVPAWVNATSSALGITDDTTSNTDYYPAWVKATSGTTATNYVTSTKYTFNPSTGKLSSTAWGGDYLDFNTGATVSAAAGRVWWDGGSTLNVGMNANVTGHVMEDQFFYVKASSAINKGEVAMFTGTVGASGVITVASATGVTNGSYIVGIAAENIATNGFGLIQNFGVMRNVNTTGYSDGDILWYDPSVTGGLTKTEPVAPNVKVQMAAVINGGSSGGGVIQIRVAPGSVLGGTDSNVQFGTLTDGDLIQYYGTGTYWRNVAPSTVTVGKATNLAGGGAGYVPYQSAAGTTLFVSAGTSGQVLTSNGASAPTWTTPTAYATVTDDTTTNATRYPLFANATSGNLTTEYVSSTKLQFNPSTGELTATSFSGAGTGLTGTASSLSIGGNAATATSATTATNIAGGASGSIPYQTASGTTAMLAKSTDGYVLTLASGLPSWAAPVQTGITIADDTTTNATRYLTFTSATTGNITTENVASTKLSFNPSTGVLSSTSFSGAGGSITGLSGSNISTGTVGLAYGGTGQASAPAAMTALMGFTSTATAAGTTTLTNASSYYQVFTGTQNQTVKLPATSTLATGWSFHIVNNSTGTLTIQTNTGTSLGTVPSGVTAMPTALTITGDTAADWEFGYTDFSTLTGTGAVVLATSPTLTTPTIGVATATSINKVAITAPATSATLTIADGKTLTASNTLTLAGTDSTTMTFPSTSQTVAGLTATQTFTNKRIDPRVSSTTSASSLTPDISAQDIYAYTALAANLTIAAPTGTPADGDKLTFRILDNGTSRTITFTGGANGFKPVGVTLTTSGSDFTYATTINKTVYFGSIWNASSSRWEIVALSQE